MSAPPHDLQTIQYEQRGAVGEICLNGPAASNAIDVATARTLAAAIGRASTDPSVRVILLRGQGRRFCGGGDLAAMAAAADREAFVAELADAAHGAIRALATSAKPVVGAVTGTAAGIGLSLVLASDVVVAGESTSFVTAYTSVGLSPDGGLSWLLPRAVGHRRATELILSSAPISARRALDLGVVSETCAESEVLIRAREVADRLAGRSPEALAESRRLVRASWTRDLEAHLDDEAATIARLAGGPCAGTLIDQFLSRR